ncbi:MAG: hypothetical protein IT264_09320 [Saprospiraceae bacterium]|nr:hypothetical protein [Saprospiraceae bacterium]
MANRIDHILNKSYDMLHKIHQGNFVICNRYYLS